MENNVSTIEYGFRRVIITVTLITCSLLELIDTSIVNVATTQLMGNLGATLSEISWVIAAYGIANVIVIPMSSWLSIRLGRKNYFGGSVVLFTIASFLCGNANGIWELVFFRFIQGMGGGALLATSQTILTEIYPPEDRGKASAMYGIGVIMGPTLGPLMGGYIVDNFDWRMIFYVNIPIGIVASFLAFTFIKNAAFVNEAMKKMKVDWLGIFLLVVGVGSLQLILEQGDREDWFESTYITIAFVTAILGTIGFIWRELTCEHPIVDLHVLKKGNVAIGTILSFILGFGLFSSVFIYPVFVQRFLGFTAFQTGLSLLPGALLSGFMMPIVGTLLAKGIQPKFLIPFGFIIFASFTFLMSHIITAQTGEEQFTFPLILRGIGLGFLFVPLTAQSLAGLQGRDIGSAAGLTGMVRQLGGSFGVAICSTFIARLTYQHRTDMVSHISIYDNATMERLNALTQGIAAKTGSVVSATQQAYYMLEVTVLKQATVLTYIDIFQYLGIFFIAVIPIVFFAKDSKPGQKVDMSDMH
jgi:DHA2 family multidrug resistance protein